MRSIDPEWLEWEEPLEGVTTTLRWSFGTSARDNDTQGHKEEMQNIL